MWVPRMSAKPLKSKSATTLSRQSTNSPPLTWARHRNLPKSHRESLGKQIPDGKNQNAHIPSMRSQQVVPWQWNLDHLHKTETSLEHFLSAMSQAGIFRVKWQDHMTNSETLSRAETPSMYSILSQRRLRWLRHTYPVDDGRIPKKDLNWQLTTGVRQVGRLVLRFKDASKRDLKACEIHPNNSENAACYRACWRRSKNAIIKKADVKRHQKDEEKRALLKNSSTLPGLLHLHLRRVQ